MGLFGLLTTIVGLGAIAKDAISDSIDDTRSRDKAIRNGRDFYLVNGYKMRSTKTGRDCTERMDYDNNHIWLCDLKTGERIVDRTLNINKEKTEKNRRKSKEEGCEFYRTCEFDLPGGKSSNVWLNDNMPGKYFTDFRLPYRGYGGNKYFVEGELVDYIIGSEKRKRVQGDFTKPKYKADGTILTEEEMKP